MIIIILIVISTGLQNVFCILKTENDGMFLKDYLNVFNYDFVEFLLTKNEDQPSLERRVEMANVLPIPFGFRQVNEETDFVGLLEDRSLYVVFMDSFTNELMRIIQKINREMLFRKMSFLIFGSPTILSKFDKSFYLAVDNMVTFVEWQITDNKNVTSNMSPMSSSTMAVNSLPLLAKIYDVYQAYKYSPYVINQRGFWSENLGLQMKLGDLAERRTNLTGLTFRCVTLEQRPFTYLDPSKPGSPVVIKGFLENVWKFFQDIYNFTYTCKTPKDMEWGTLKDGNWSGLIKELVDMTSDVIIAPTDFTPQRAEAVDFLAGVRSIGYRMVVRRPSLTESTWKTFVSELGLYSWIVLVVMMLLVPLLLAFVTKISPKEETRIKINDAYMISFGALFFQGSWLEVSSTSSRIIFITIFISTLAVYYHYTSILVAQLTISPKRSTPFDTLQGLLKHGGYDFGFKEGVSLEENFKSNENPPYKDLWKNIISKKGTNLVSSDEDGIYKVKTERYIYLMEKFMFNFEFNNECDVMLLPNDYFRSVTGIALTKNSPYTKIFNYQLSKLRDSGVLERFWKSWQSTRSLCESSAFLPVSINQTFTVFLVLLLGLLAALFLILPLEKLSSRSISPNSIHMNEVTRFRAENFERKERKPINFFN